MSHAAKPNPNEPRALNDDAVLERHEGPVRTPTQLIAAVTASFIVPIVAIFLLVSYVTNNNKQAPGSDLNDPKAVAARIAPVAKVEWKDASVARVLKTGNEVYTAQCAACHAAGAAGAPKLGDATAWGPRIKTGYEALVASSLKGKGAMGAQGGGDFEDTEIARAVAYMANAGGAKFAEPSAPVPAAAVAAAAPVATVAAVTPGAPNAVQAALAAAAATAPAVVKVNAGEALYKQACVACHANSVAGSPKFGDKAAWAPRVGQGIATLTDHVIKGKGAMPPKGGSTASDADIKAAVEYMVAAVK
jgi:cytochrome c5